MYHYLIPLLFLFSCSKPALNPPNILTKDCEQWDTHIDSSEEFLCALKYGESPLKLKIEKDIHFKERVVIDKALQLTGISLLKAPAFRFEKNTEIYALGFKGEVSFLENVKIRDARFESPTEFKGKQSYLSSSTFNAAIFISGYDLYFEKNRVFGDLTLESKQIAYVLHNQFIGEEGSTLRFKGIDFFVEQNCRLPQKRWPQSTEDFRGNRIQKQCEEKTICSLYDASSERFSFFESTHFKVGDFDGDHKDEILRIEENAWHVLDNEKRRWSLVGRFTNTPPWAIRVVDIDGDGKDEIVKADGYRLRTLSGLNHAKWIDGPEFEAAFARQYLMFGNIRGDKKKEVLKFDRRTRWISASDYDTPEWKQEIELGDDMVFIKALDLNGDGLSEIVSQGAMTGKLSSLDIRDLLFKNRGSGWFATGFPHFSKLNPKRPPKDRLRFGYLDAHDSFPFFILDYLLDLSFSADMNGDGFEDLFGPCTQECALDPERCEPLHPFHFAHSENKSPFRLATYNINHAGIRSTGEIAWKIRTLNADFVAIQEVDRNTKRNPYDMVKVLKEITGYKHSFFLKTNDYQGGDYGQLILSRQPILKTKILKLPAHENKKEWSEHNAAVLIESEKGSFIATHIIARKWRNGEDFSKTQDAQIAALIQWVNQEKPDYLLGDFNIEADSAAYKSLIKGTNYADSFVQYGRSNEVTFPDLHGRPRRIDYVFLRSKKKEIIKVRIPAFITSDHYPYLVEFKP